LRLRMRIPMRALRIGFWRPSGHTGTRTTRRPRLWCNAENVRTLHVVTGRRRQVIEGRSSKACTVVSGM
jgi:hypothetical protein